MKKILLFTLLLCFISCSSSDEGINNQSSISPPDWIQGTWLLDGTASELGFKFTSNDFCVIVLSNLESCFNEQLDQTSNAGGTTNVSETITDNNYTIEITLISQTVTYQFEKVSSTQIEWINDPLGDLAETIYVKE